MFAGEGAAVPITLVIGGTVVHMADGSLPVYPYEQPVIENVRLLGVDGFTKILLVQGTGFGNGPVVPGTAPAAGTVVGSYSTVVMVYNASDPDSGLTESTVECTIGEGLAVNFSRSSLVCLTNATTGNMVVIAGGQQGPAYGFTPLTLQV